MHKVATMKDIVFFSHINCALVKTNCSLVLCFHDIDLNDGSIDNTSYSTVGAIRAVQRGPSIFLLFEGRT